MRLNFSLSKSFQGFYTVFFSLQRTEKEVVIVAISLHGDALRNEKVKTEYQSHERSFYICLTLVGFPV